MKKILLLLISLFCGFQSYAQDPDPELFKTWYLRVLGLDFLNLVIEDISPPIYPTLTITETLSFYGESACNTFSGTMSYDGVTDLFEIVSIDRTNNTCTEPSHQNFEVLYLEFFELGRPPFHAYVGDDGNGEQSLETIGPWWPLLGLKNFPLVVPENDKLDITIFPNPVAETLFITSEGIRIENIKIYSIRGNQVIEASANENSLDVSNLSEGLYFIEISSSEGKSVQKFVKK